MYMDDHCMHKSLQNVRFNVIRQSKMVTNEGQIVT
jgi:hypothetical protein